MTPALAILLTYCLHMSQPAISGLQNAIYSRFLTHQHTPMVKERFKWLRQPSGTHYPLIYANPLPYIFLRRCLRPIYLLIRIMIVVCMYCITVCTVFWKHVDTSWMWVNLYVNSNNVIDWNVYFLIVNVISFQVHDTCKSS